MLISKIRHVTPKRAHYHVNCINIDEMQINYFYVLFACWFDFKNVYIISFYTAWEPLGREKKGGRDNKATVLYAFIN